MQQFTSRQQIMKILPRESRQARHFARKKQGVQLTVIVYRRNSSHAAQNARLQNMSLEIATLAGGCFWCLEAVFVELRGVEKVVSGYSGGRMDNPTYQQVCSETTGHAEVVQVHFDPSVIAYSDLLDVFFTIHDPTTLNRQGNDVGESYRSAIFYHDQAQLEAAKKAIEQFSSVYDNPIVTQLEPLTKFYSAEAYHQDYFARNPSQPYCMAIVAPKVSKARKYFTDKLKARVA
jgi:peptide-methionine (S)-S-oxide reductase